MNKKLMIGLIAGGVSLTIVGGTLGVLFGLDVFNLQRSGKVTSRLSPPSSTAVNSFIDFISGDSTTTPKTIDIVKYVSENDIFCAKGNKVEEFNNAFYDIFKEDTFNIVGEYDTKTNTDYICRRVLSPVAKSTSL